MAIDADTLSARIEPPASDRRWSTDRIVSLSAMAVGICSLFITVYQTYLIREAQSASVLPYLAFGITSNNEGAYLTLRNDGVGPARLESVRIHFKGQIADGDPYDFFLAHRTGPPLPGLSVDRVTPGRLLPANSTIPMLGIAGNAERVKALGDMLRIFTVADAPPSWLDELQARGGDKAVIDIVFSSVYGDRWRIRSDGLVPQPQ